MLLYRGAVYREARTREDIYWKQLAQIAEQLVDIAEHDIDPVSKRELAQEILLLLKEQVWKIGIWSV